MKFLKYNEIRIDKWDQLILESPCSSPFQTLEFYKLCNSGSNLSAEVFAVEDSGDLKILCVVSVYKEKGISSYFSRRAIVYGGPVFVDFNEQIFEYFLRSILIELKKCAIYVEIRNFFDYRLQKSIYYNVGWTWLPYLNIRIKTKDKSLNDVLSLMKYNRKREIKLSFAEGASFKEAKDKSEIAELFRILKDLYSEKVKLPLPDLSFFLNLSGSPIGKVFVVHHEEKIIGGTFCFYLKNRSLYTMYYCGIRDYHKKIFPAHLSIVAALDFSTRNNVEYVDLMGAGIIDKEYGVRNYKMEFGGELEEFGRFRKINNKFLFSIGETGLKFLKLRK